MLFLEEHARSLLVLHTVVATALVAASTHLVVWIRGFPRGRFTRLAGVKRLALLSFGLYVASFVLGNLVYPVYKIRVRKEFLEQPSAVIADRELRDRAAATALERYREALRAMDLPDDEVPVPTATNVEFLPLEHARIARWFDVKEHWSALGLALSAACLVILLTWNPKRDGRSLGAMVFLFAFGAAAAVWMTAVIGVVVAAYRAV